MTTYNGETFIRDAISSILNQALTDWELIVVDDCSTDSTREIIAKYADADTRVRMLSTESRFGGPAKGKNIGILHAQGQVISFMDQDDKDHPDKLRLAKAVFDKYPETELVYFDVTGFSEQGDQHCSTHEKTAYLKRARNYLQNIDSDIYQCSKNYVGCMAGLAVGLSTQGMVTRRSVFLDKLTHLFSEQLKIIDDIDMFFRLADCCNMKYVHQPMAYYRHRPDSLSARYGRMMQEAAKFHTSNLASLRDRLRPKEIQRYKRQIANLFFRLGYYYGNDPRQSRKYYFQSACYHPRPAAFFSALKTCLPFYANKFPKRD